MHLLVAFVWIFLLGNQTLGGLLIGLFAGYLLLAIFKRALLCESYVRRTNALAAYAVYFIKEVVLSNFRIAMVAISRKPSAVKGNFIAYDVEGMTTFEILLLSHCLNLTPGTIVASRSYDKAEIVIHTFAVGKAEQVRVSIDDMKSRIQRFSR